MTKFASIAADLSPYAQARAAGIRAAIDLAPAGIRAALAHSLRRAAYETDRASAAAVTEWAIDILVTKRSTYRPTCYAATHGNLADAFDVIAMIAGDARRAYRPTMPPRD
jgi:hypothetical protein